MRRRLVTIPGLFIAGILLLVLVPVWVPVAFVFDLVRGRWRCPTVRLLSFAVAWSWLEIIGVKVSLLFWVCGQRSNQRIHYALQRWWATRLLQALRICCGVSVVVENVEALHPGPVLLFARHASLADSLVSAFVVGRVAGMKPRYVLKRELLSDPCLDVVGQRLPNHFLDRDAPDSTPELQALEMLVGDMDDRSVGIIFPEGTRANPNKRRRALERIGRSDAERGARLAPLEHLLPPRPSGAMAMAKGNPHVDIVTAWHVGFEGLDTFGGIYEALSRTMPPVRFVLQRHSRTSIPAVGIDDGRAFTTWLDTQWVEMDTAVDRALRER